MAGFLRPGATSKSAFGVSFEADKDRDNGPAPVFFNANQNLGLQAQRKALPIAKYRDQILYLVEHHPAVIIIGETGSGKTTQIPQLLLEAGWASEGRIACTQPRRVAAMTVAARVAAELGCTVGQDVGYSIRFEDVSTPAVTKIKFLTDGVLLREMTEDPLLTQYSVVMVDEAHERSLATDLLLGLLKKVQRVRPDLKVIIASATLQAQKVADFFTPEPGQGSGGGAALLSVEGRAFDVQIHYLQQPAADYVKTAVWSAIELHSCGLPGDILIFFTGQDECEVAVSLLEDEAKRMRKKGSRLRLFPVALYAGLPAANQLQALEPAPRGYRKIICGTNIAETSLTIGGIVFVIDSCFSKQSFYDPLTGLTSLAIGPISQASGTQRAGRAGRERPGHCLRLCTEEAYLSLPQETVPEMQRSDLTGAALQLKAMGIDNLTKFDFLDPPPAEAMIRALEQLHALGALDSDGRLTSPLGHQMAELPLDPRLGRALLASCQLGCSQEVAIIAAMLSVNSIWYMGGGHQALHTAKAKFAVGEGDLISYLNVWEAWKGAGEGRPSWAHRHSLNHRTLLRVADIQSQLGWRLRRLNFELQSCEGDTERVQKALAHGLICSAVRFDTTTYSATEKHHTGTDIYRLIHNAAPGEAPRLRIHTNSLLYRTQPPFLVFWQVQPGPKGFFDMQDLMAIEPEWLPEIAPDMYQMIGNKGKRVAA